MCYKIVTITRAKGRTKETEQKCLVRANKRNLTHFPDEYRKEKGRIPEDGQEQTTVRENVARKRGPRRKGHVL